MTGAPEEVCDAAVSGCAARPAAFAPENGEALDFRGMEILAPMVRAGTAALRWEALRYGADLVFGEEVIDRKIIGAVRVENPAFGLVDYVSPREQGVTFSTRPQEKARLFFQLGTANAALATEAALTVCRDVRGIDVNMGCPKSFSVKGGMGAALLGTPEVASDILKTLRRNLPSTCALTCKIRMLASTEKTRDFMRVCEASGAEAVTVHMRQRSERPAEPAHWDEIVRLWDAVRVPVLANGDFFTRRQIDEFWKLTRKSAPQSTFEDAPAAGPAAVMVARGALWNPAIFYRSGPQPDFQEVVKGYVASAVASNCTYQNTKYVLSQMLAGGIGVTPPTAWGEVPMKLFNRDVSGARSMAAICVAVGLGHEAASFPPAAHTTVFYRNGGGKALLDAAKAACGLASAEEAAEGGTTAEDEATDAAAGERDDVAGTFADDQAEEGSRKRARLSVE